MANSLSRHSVHPIGFHFQTNTIVILCTIERLFNSSRLEKPRPHHDRDRSVSLQTLHLIAIMVRHWSHVEGYMRTKIVHKIVV